MAEPAGLANITGITLVKRFTYRGDSNEEFSSTYWLSQSVPANSAEWDVLRNKVVAAEQQVFLSTVKIVRVIGYNSSQPGAVAVYDNVYLPGQEPPGTLPLPSGGVQGSGDQAACVEWHTDKRSTKGKPVYLRKFLHLPIIVAGGGDSLHANYIAGLQAYADMFLGGGFVGQLRSPNESRFATSTKVNPYVTTRTLKRRGKKKKPA